MYIKIKHETSLRKFNGAVKANFIGDEIQKEGVHYACIACVT